MPATIRPASFEVPLSRFPDQLSIPVGLQDRLRFEPDRRVLAFDGFMSAADYGELARLSTDADYRLALDDLFRIAVPETAPRGLWPRWAAWLVIVLSLGVFAAIALLIPYTFGAVH